MEQFKKLALAESLMRVLQEKGFESPTEIQEKAIPLVLEKKDIIAGSATGSGKTLAFGAGIISSITKGNGVQALILTPTRELAEQVSSALKEFSQYEELEVVAVYGGVSLENQVKKISHADIVVGTPGRLLDHLRRNSLDLTHVHYLVLDEADRMWDMGFKEDVGTIVEQCPKKRQTLLFSATISPELADFSEKYMRKPTEISVESQVDPSKLRQIYYDVRDNEKFSLLVHLLQHEDSHLVMVFCNTRRMADFVAKNLVKNNVDAQVIHGGMSQDKRLKVLKKFDTNTINVLIATDVAARGLDITGITHVYNYDTAGDARDHVHRVGRTARAGKEGIAISLLTSRDYDNFANVQKHYPEMKILRKETPRFERVFVKMERREEKGRNKNTRRNDGRQGNFRSRGNTRGRSDSRRPNTRGREQRGERNKRSNKPQGRTGFRGSGRNTRRNQTKRR